MKNIMKRLTSFVMVLVFIIGFVPPIEVEAAKVDGTSKIKLNTIEKLPGQGASGFQDYKINITWVNEPNMADPNLRPYHIYYRNLTTGGPLVKYGLPIPLNTASASQNHELELRLQDGCFYEFTVVPVYEVTPPPPALPFLEEKPSINQWAVLSNMNVKAIGEDGEMTVEFNLPKVNGGHFFHKYKIYWANLDNDTSAPLKWVPVPETVLATDLEIDPVKGSATHKFPHSDFIVGRIFAVKVEPVYWRGIDEVERADGNDFLINLTGIESHLFSSDINIDYMTDKAYIRPNVFVKQTTQTTLEISWDSMAGKPLSSKIDRIILYQVTKDANGVPEVKQLTQWYGAGKESVTSHSTPKPDSDYIEYYIEVVYNDIKYKKRDGATQTPYAVTVESKHAIFDPRLIEFSPYRPDIYELKDNEENPLEITATWKAFLRQAYTAEEEGALYKNTGKFLDKELDYFVYVTDDPANFKDMTEAHAYKFPAELLPLSDVDGYPHFTEKFTQFYARDMAGFAPKDLIENKIYYFKVIAKQRLTDRYSQAAYGAHYIMPIGKIPVEPNSMAKPPLRIKLLDGAEVITNDSITIEWDEQWPEIYNPITGKWYSKVGVLDGKLVYGDDERIKYDQNLLYMHRALNDDGTINRALTFSRIKEALKPYFGSSDIIVLRVVDIRGSSYKIHNAEYNVVEAYGNDKYYDDISAPTTTFDWDTVSGIIETSIIGRELLVKTSHNPKNDPLKEGTAYAIFLRPFMKGEHGDLLAFYPSYVTTTTLTGRNPVDIDPIVPILEPVGSTDVTITVRWEYFESLAYEMRFSDKMTSYSEGGLVITNEDIIANGRKYNEEGTGTLYMEYTIPKLFPDTRYYVWINSKSTDKTSAWSTPVEIRTKDIEAPPPPTGLGLIAESHLREYNSDKNKDYEKSTGDSVMAEFQRIEADIKNTATTPPTTGTGENPAPPTEEELKKIVATFLGSPSSDSKYYMLRYSSLDPNRTYSIRAKTRLSIKKTSEGLGERSYSYVVEFSTNENFLDSVIIEVPATADISGNVLYRDSEWTSATLYSKKDDTEYDGDKDPNTYPLPFDDFEVTYDPTTSTLTHRFRSNQVAADRTRDNNVDERFITRLVNNKTFIYDMDVSKYNKTTHPNNRVIEIPYSIIDAFNQRKISLRIKADNLTITFEPGAFTTTDVQTLTNLDKSANVKITLNQNPNGLPGDNYISVPHKLSTTVNTKARSVSIKNYAKPISVKFALTGQYVENATNMSNYVLDQNSNGWQPLVSTFNTADKSITSVSNKSDSTYSAIGIKTPGAVAGQTVGKMYSANSKLAIIDMGVYNENLTLHPNQFNQIVAAALKDSKTVNMNSPLSTEDHTALGKGGLLVTGGGNVSREQGITVLVKLYELKSKSPVTGYPKLNETVYTDIKNATGAYQTPLLKAAELGFFRGINKADPKGALTLGDLMHILDIVLNY